MEKELKLKTKIIHKFDIEPELLDDLDFNVTIPHESFKVKTKIIEVKKKTFRKDASTRLF